MSTKQLKQAETAKEQKTKGSKKEQEKRNEKRNNSLRVRVFPIWLRIIIVIILAIFALVAGLMIGFGIIGDGNPIDALKVETWRHIIDIVIK